MIDAQDIPWFTYLEEHLQAGEECKIKVLILATPRTGSTYFSHCLGKLLNLNYTPEELFIPHRTMPYLKHFHFGFEEYLRELFCVNIFVTKCMIHHYNFWLCQGTDIFEYFDLVCYLTRKDERAQAKSIIISRETEIWKTETKRGHWSSRYVMREAGIKIPDITEDEIETIIDWKNREINQLTTDFLERAQHIYYFEDFIASDKPITEFASIIEELAKCTVK
jgi:hypothetical protein